MPIPAGSLPFKAANGGYFKSIGEGRHPTRKIDSFELIFVEHGCLKLYENDLEFTLLPGDCLILYPDREHGGLSDYQTDLKFYWLHFSVDESHQGHFSGRISQKTSLHTPERMVTWFRRFLNDQETGTGFNIQADLLLTLILTELVRPSSDPVMKRHNLADMAYDYLKLNYSDDILIADVADRLGCNVDYLGRIFKQTYGMTMNQCLNKLRLARCRQLLLDSSMNINEIALETGFNDITYFRRRFKTENGISPCKFRKMYGKVYVNTH